MDTGRGAQQDLRCLLTLSSKESRNAGPEAAQAAHSGALGPDAEAGIPSEGDLSNACEMKGLLLQLC